MTHTQRSAREAANFPEIAAFCGMLTRHVMEGGHERELEAVARALITRARREGLGASTIIGAIELVGCPPVQEQGPRRAQRVDRYTTVMANLLREFLHEPQ
jgi:hypothetical protein